jgi:hypothetical protein
MASPITNSYAATVSATCTQASLASSTAGVGRVATEFSTANATHMSVMEKFKNGTSPANNSPVYVFAVANNGAGTPVRTDGVGATDAGATFLNANLIMTLTNAAAAATGDTIIANVTIPVGWPTMSLGVVQATTVTANATGSNFDLSYILFNLQM